MAMTRDEIKEKLKEVLKMAMGTSADGLIKCSEEDRLNEDLGLNSVGILYVVVAIEEFFDIQFQGVGFGDFKTVKDVIDYIEQHAE
ncbi:MAG: acyl carrier protein [Clostridiales bacterium]|nr:acyl carrier protein [Clostridiales bacterium]